MIVETTAPHFHRQPIVMFFHLLWFAGLILFCVSWAFPCYYTLSGYDVSGCSTFWALNTTGWILIFFALVGICVFRRRYYHHYHCAQPQPQVVVVAPPQGYQAVAPAQAAYYPAPAGYGAAPAGYAAAPAGYAAPPGYTAYQQAPVDYPGVKIDP